MHMTIDNETRKSIAQVCEDTVDKLSKLAGEAHGVTVDLWCSSNDPGWKFSINVPAKD